jgi:DNA-binding response OmpR family regulator
LARTPERIVTAEELWQYAWGSEKPLNSESLHVFMYRLRGKLAPYSLQIETMINVGYRLLIHGS